jgi:hypothetical protein
MIRDSERKASAFSIGPSTQGSQKPATSLTKCISATIIIANNRRNSIGVGANIARILPETLRLSPAFCGFT